MIPSARAYLIWRRNADVYLKPWILNFLPPFLEPVLYVAIFGAGIGALVRSVPVSGREIPYLLFISPGMISVAIMQQAFSECTYGTFIRMYYQKTFDAITATPCSLEDVVAGEIAWGATKAVISTAIMLPLLAAFGLIQMPSSLWFLPLSLLAGWFFAAFALCIAALVPQIDAFNLPMFLLFMPMFALSETFFPLPLSGWMRMVGNALPLTHVSRIGRAAALGQISLQASWPGLVTLAILALVLSFLGAYLMRRRLIP